MKFMKTKTIGAKLLSGILSVAMILSSFPTNVAYANEAEVPDAQVTVGDDQLGELISEVVVGEPVDDNVGSIPENEDGDDQFISDVDTPPNIPSGTATTDGDTTEIVDQSGTEDDTIPSGTDDTIPSGTEDETPSGTEDDTIPSGTEDDNIPSGTEDEVIPSGTEDDNIPSGTEDETIPSGTEDETIPSGTEEELIPSGTVDDETIPSGTEEEIIPSGTEDETIPSGTEEEIPTGTDDEIPGGDDAEIVPTPEVINPIFDYSVIIDTKDLTVTENNELTIASTITATKTTGEEVENVTDYTFEYVVTDTNGDAISDTFADSTNNITTITFTVPGNYIITANVYDVDGELQATDTTTVTVEKELPLITFDQIYTPFDTSLVQTLDLIIKTSDPSVFTKNTNVVSNFDNVYIISCSSLDEARSVYSYYIDKVDAISDMSNVMSIATDDNSEDIADLDNLNENTDDAIAQLSEIVPEVTYTDYSDYIALIDTGANADINFSVVGEDTTDSNGHGSLMLDYIKAENPNAKVMSIKVFEGSSTSAANVYAGIKLAIESKVKIINLSLVGANTEKNAIVTEVIQEALDAGIIVIGAAGNYNTNAKNFIPGAIDGVIVVGAIKDNGYKYPTSNYNADLYVKATSTSEATARYSGMYSANNTDNDKVRVQTVEDTIHDDKKLYK